MSTNPEQQIPERPALDPLEVVHGTSRQIIAFGQLCFANGDIKALRSLLAQLDHRLDGLGDDENEGEKADVYEAINEVAVIKQALETEFLALETYSHDGTT